MLEEEFTNVLFRTSNDKEFSIHQPHLSGNQIVFHRVMKTERKVRIDRSSQGGLGISVKGGSEHNIPVIISRVFTQPINGEILEPGDALVEINEKSVVDFTHDQVVQILRSCGPVVYLTVKTFEHAHHILHGPPEAIDNSHSFPLLFSRIKFSDNSKSYEAEIVDSDGKIRGHLKFPSIEELQKFENSLSRMRNFINIRNLNRSDIEYADWISTDDIHLFVVLSNNKISVLLNPPEITKQLDNGSFLHESLLYEIENTNNCSLQIENKMFLLKFNTKAQQNVFTEKFFKLTKQIIDREKVFIYACRSNNEDLILILDDKNGISMKNKILNKQLWSFGFNQLANSFDEGNVIKFDFKSENGKLSQKVFTSERKHQLLFCLHSLLYMKVYNKN